MFLCQEVRNHVEWLNSSGRRGDRARLSGANLSGVRIRGAQLREAYLDRADLSRARLGGADLREANLSGADLSAAYLGGADLSDAYMAGADLFSADLDGADLSKADLTDANLPEARLTRADLSAATLSSAVLDRADLSEACLIRADLRSAGLSGANLSGADLRGAVLQEAVLVSASLTSCDLRGASVYGTSVWDIETNKETKQTDLIITPGRMPEVRVDDLEVAQFVYLLLHRQKLRNVIDTITSKAVLILGRFTSQRKAVLDAMADELRNRGLLPIIFDFERSTSLDFTETIRVLAGMSLFVIADITNPQSAPLELQATVPDYKKPFVPIIQEGERPFSMFSDLGKYDWMLKPLLTYSSLDELMRGFEALVIRRALEQSQELLTKKAQQTEMRSVDDMIQELESQTE
jgi:uncharacterized protein YjbI with pentapeptide repeats